MNDICVPIPRIPEAKHAEVAVTVEGKVKAFNFRVESFSWQSDESQTNATDFLKIRADRIDNLKRSIEGYDKNWEVVQIYNPGPRDEYINVLFRQKNLA